MKMIVDELIAGDHSLETVVQDYFHAQAVLQTVTNPSGTFNTGAGLGEPKFNIDGTRFNGNWGRPQRDGPALRATALMTYAEYLIARGQYNTAKKVIWPIVSDSSVTGCTRSDVFQIINDLNYVGQYWNQTGFDLWEEVKGSSFFTIQVQHRALSQGSVIARVLGQSCHSCDVVAPQLLCFLQSFWNGTSLIANINEDNGRSGRDANTMLGPIATFDVTASCSDASLQPCSSKVLASHKVLVDSFRSIYPINKNKDPGKAAAVGRYPEDIYYNGNPWYLCTLAAAEVLYDAVAQFKLQRSLAVDSISFAFFKDLYPSVKQQTYRSNSAGFSAITKAMTQYADGFVNIVQQYLPANGSISEQYDRTTGLPLSAYDLTWSFASFVTMAERRSGYYPFPWGARIEAPAPSTCATTTVNGTYVPAFAAGAPNVTNSCTVQTQFNVNASTYFGENIFLIGSTNDTGNYNPANGDPMDASNYTSARHLWDLNIGLVAGETLKYQYVRQESDGSYIHETINRTVQIPACGQPGPTLEDKWVGPGGGD
jgi:glucoamylase